MHARGYQNVHSNALFLLTQRCGFRKLRSHFPYFFDLRDKEAHDVTLTDVFPWHFRTGVLSYAYLLPYKAADSSHPLELGGARCTR
jgi:hypothetical protein